MFICCYSVSKSYLILYDSHGLHAARHAVLHHLPEFAQIHAHWVGDAILPSHLLPWSPFAISLFQHQGLLQWVGSSRQVASIGLDWSVSFSISHSNKYSVLISFRIDWFDTYVCVYVHTYVYIYIYAGLISLHKYIYIYIYTHTHTFIYILCLYVNFIYNENNNIRSKSYMKCSTIIN